MQAEWAARLRALPAEIRAALAEADDRAVRHQPAEGEWSAIEVLGHLIDKMELWRERVERIVAEERPWLPSYDQDASVRDHDYQQGDRRALLGELAERCERCAKVVEQLPEAALERVGVHAEFGPMTARECVEAVLDSLPDHVAQLRAALASAGNP